MVYIIETKAALYLYASLVIAIVIMSLIC